MFEPTGAFPIPTKDVISWIFDNPAYNQDRPVYVDAHNEQRSISCNQARSLVRQLIAGLRASGVKPGDCVAIHSFNDIYYSILVLAIVGVGGVFTGTNPSYSATELSHHIKTSRATFLISETALWDPIFKAAKENNVPESHIWTFDPLSNETPKGRRSWRELFNHGEQDWIRFNDLKTASTVPAARLFSSGTTGLPKAATITHYNLVAQHELVYAANARPYQISLIVPLPLFHAAAAPVAHFGALASGQVVYLMRRFELESFLQFNDKFQATEMMVVPPMAVAIVMSPYAKTRKFLTSVRHAVCGAAPLDKVTQSRLLAMLGDGATFNQVWGMTETCCIATQFPPGEHDDTGSIGRPITSVQLKLIDDNGKDISGYDIRGEICVTGPTVTPGYFGNPKANAESFDANGWYKTGDIGYCCGKTKKWYIVDRKKELIKVRGFQVAPPELEGVLLTHPDIVDAAVIGIPVECADGESPRAYVVRRPNKGQDALAEKDVQEYLGKRLAKYKALTGGVKFVHAIPKNASGKILKRLLREEYKKERAAVKL